MPDGDSRIKGPEISWKRYLDLQIIWPGWVVENYLPEKSLICLYGARGGGKTFVALDWAASIAAGSEWLGNKVVAPGRVAYLLAERADGLRRRLMGWLETRRGDEDRLHANLIAAQGSYPLDTKDGQDAVIDSLKDENAIRLLVVDPLASFMQGSENETRDMQKFIEGIRRISEELSCSILLVHHEGKRNFNNALGARGSSALEAGLDTVIYLKVEKDKSNWAELCVTKQREFEAAPTMQMMFKSVVSSETQGVGVRALGKFPELPSPDEAAERSKVHRPRKDERMKARDAAIVRAVEDVRARNHRAEIGMIRAALAACPAGAGADFSKLTESTLRGRLKWLAESGRLEETKSGRVLSYDVVERRQS